MFEPPPGLGPTRECRSEQEISAKAACYHLATDRNCEQGGCQKPWLADGESMKVFAHTVLG